MPGKSINLKEVTYTFRPAANCNMCGAPSNRFRILGKRLNKRQGFKPQKKAGLCTTVVQCRDCGLIFADPMPVPGSIQDHYAIPAEDYWQKEYFEIRPGTPPVNNLWESRLGEIPKNFTALDIGAGIGKDMRIMEAMGMQAYGIEPSETFYRKALEISGIPAGRLVCARLEEAEFEKNFFDFINFGAVLEHLYDPSAAIARALKWLKPGGKIYIEVPHARWLIATFINASYKLRGLDYVTNLSPMHSPYHLYEFTPEAFAANAGINNYSVHAIDYFVCQTPLTGWPDKLLKRIMKYTRTGMELSVWLEKPV